MQQISSPTKSRYFQPYQNFNFHPSSPKKMEGKKRENIKLVQTVENTEVQFLLLTAFPIELYKLIETKTANQDTLEKIENRDKLIQ